ncbi:hypothetical protein CHS0354_002573 [Potamilus streckersoni]|uniref:Fibrinogen C-terminal domain-containing protein n=1 Tax=Potamilus streckersoni TaxID=2493646 RepID=A0AAE0RP85_9BIVA|nr:hypothetical protein CHS0354_002573 [Potamilus streckersoni]
MGLHSTLFIFLTLDLTINVCIVTALERYFCENVKCSNLKNRVCTNYLLWTVTDTRKSQCFLKCLTDGERCQAVFYNDITRKCQGHSSVLTSQDNCLVEDGTKYYHKCTARRPGNCQEILCSGQDATGVYTIYPDANSNGVNVRCDMDTDGGGWTVFQRRVDGSVDFYRNWAEYKFGFGNADTEYWLGLETIHKLTSQANVKLRVDLIAPGSPQIMAYAAFSSFTVGDETSNYRLTVAGYSGNAGDSLSNHSNMMFTTKDKDNDLDGNINCAVYFVGAWWYNKCHLSSLNGLYGGYEKGINWKTLSGSSVSMTFSAMKLK